MLILIQIFNVEFCYNMATIFECVTFEHVTPIQKTGTSLDTSIHVNGCQGYRKLLPRVFIMASKAEIICLLFSSFFAIGSATYCTYNRDCDTWSGESCCSDSVCRETCYYCSYDYQCGTGECCNGGDCSSVCSIWTGGAIAGAVVGLIVFFGIIISIVACCCCACCPYYRYRSPGTVLVTQPGYQPFVSTTQTTSIAQQQYPPPGYAQQPPPPYPNYQQQPGHYPPPQTQGQPPIPPPVSAGGPVKY